MSYKKEQQITRIKSVYVFLKQHGPTNTYNLAEEFDCSVRTIRSDLRILREHNAVKQLNRGFWKAS